MQEKNISASNFEQCLKCNLCTEVCPMMAVNPHYPGPKQAGPDGERYRLKDPFYYDLTLKYCLNCKRCEVACPSGVKVGDLIQTARIRYDKPRNPIRDKILASTDAVGAVATKAAPVVNFAMGLSPVKGAMDAVLKVHKGRTFPAYASETFEHWFRRHLASQERFSRKVSYFHGCYANWNYPQLGRDFVKVMNACGYGVELLEKEKCCSVAMISNGFAQKAKKNALLNISSMRKAGREVLTTSSTCTFTMRDEYPHILGVDNSDVRDSILLATKFIFDKVEAGEIKLHFKEGYSRKIAYHSACHMEKLGWVIYSLSLLKMIPGCEVTMLPSHCCGIAGTFGFKKENYPYSQAIGEKLFSSIREADPDIVATDCETCKWQIEMSTGYKVMNPISILAEALDMEKMEKI